MDCSHVWVQVLASCSGALAHLMSGSLLGWTSPVQIQFQQDGNVSLTEKEFVWLAGFIHMGMLCSPLPMIMAANYVGRKSILLATAVPFLVCWIMLIVSGDKTVWFAGRLIGGIGSGGAFAVTPIYIAEIADDEMRGTLMSIFQVMLSIGTFFEYSFGPYVSFDTLGIASAMLPALLIATIIWVPESPFYLIMNNRVEAAEESLSRLHQKAGKEELAAKLDFIQRIIKIYAAQHIRDLTHKRANRKGLLVVFGLIFQQQFTGIVPVLSFMARIVQLFETPYDTNICVIIIGVLNVVFCIIGSMAVTRIRRRRMVLTSTLGCTISLIAIGLYFVYSKDITLKWLPIIAMIAYIVSFALGLGPLPWVIADEVFVDSIIYLAVGLAAMFTGALGLITILIFHEICSPGKEYAPFFLFAAFGVIGLLWMYSLLPETKDKSALHVFIEFGGLQDLAETEEGVTARRV